MMVTLLDGASNGEKGVMSIADPDLLDCSEDESTYEAFGVISYISLDVAALSIPTTGGWKCCGCGTINYAPIDEACTNTSCKHVKGSAGCTCSPKK